MKVYASTPSIDEKTLTHIQRTITAMKAAESGLRGVHFEKCHCEVWENDGWRLGTLQQKDSGWVFTPENDSEVEIEVELDI